MKQWVYQFHRDTRLSEVMGDQVIEREPSRGGGEVVRQRSIRGGLLTAEIAVLDELSRAPGEALNALLRALNERTDNDGHALPLSTCFATGNPPSDEHFNESLDPAALDRFAVHVRLESLIEAGDWTNAAKVIEASATCSTDADADIFVVDSAAAMAAARRVALSVQVRDLLLRFVSELRSCARSSLGGWSDRALLAKSCLLIKAAAALDDSATAKPRHLLALSHMFDFRVVPADRAKVNGLLRSLVFEAEDGGEGDAPSSSVGAFSFSSGQQPRENGAGAASQAAPTTVSSLAKTKLKQLPASEAGHVAPVWTKRVATIVAALLAALLRLKEVALPPERRSYEIDQATAHGISILTRRLVRGVLKTALRRQKRSGRVSAANATVCDAAGVPRHRIVATRLSDAFLDDPVETAIWCDQPSPTLPRALARRRSRPLTTVCLLKDTSSSMAGPKAVWASKVSLALLDAFCRHDFNYGIVDFSDKDQVRIPDPFDRDTPEKFCIAASHECGGLTNLEHALRHALDAIESRRHTSKRLHSDHVVIVTDGQPTEGSLDNLKRQLARAVRLGVKLTPVFVGPSDAMPYHLPLIAALTSSPVYHAAPRFEANVNCDAELLFCKDVALDLIEHDPSLRLSLTARPDPDDHAAFDVLFSGDSPLQRPYKLNEATS